MKPQSNGLVELHDSKERESICFDLMGFIAEEAESLGIKYTGQHQELWDKRLAQMKARQCAYRDRCPRYMRTARRVGAIPLSLFDEIINNRQT